MSDNYVSADQLNAASVVGEVNGNGVLADVEVSGVVINRHEGLPIATRERLGGVIVGDHLEITEHGILSVTVTDSMEMDNTNPITAAAVYTQVGNINALLETI